MWSMKSFWFQASLSLLLLVSIINRVLLKNVDNSTGTIFFTLFLKHIKIKLCGRYKMLLLGCILMSFFVKVSPIRMTKM